MLRILGSRQDRRPRGGENGRLWRVAVRASLGMAVALAMLLGGGSAGLSAAGPGDPGSTVTRSAPEDGGVLRCETQVVYAKTTDAYAETFLYFENVPGVQAIDVALTFNTGIGNVRDEDPDNPDTQIKGVCGILCPYSAQYNTVDNTAGTIWYVATQTGGDPWTESPSGRVAIVRFVPVTAGTITLHWGDSSLSDPNGELIAHTKQDCQIVFEAPTAVQVAGFAARPLFNSIRVKWKTSQEIDNVGFNLYRSTTRLGEREKLNPELIPSLVPPGSAFGAKYVWPDIAVVPGQGYFYWLEAIDSDGDIATFGPAKARANP